MTEKFSSISNLPFFFSDNIILIFIALITLLGTIFHQETEHLNRQVFEEFSQAIPETDETIDMVPVPGGIFTMGTPEDHGIHQVQVDSFWIGKYEITWDQYDLFAEASVEDLRRELFKTFYDVDIDEDAISSPTLTDEVLEVLRESEISADVMSTPSPSYGDVTFGMGKEGFPAIGMTHYAAVMFTKWLTVKTGEFYRLPTEAEWEFACRAGLENEISQDNIDQYAWHRENSNRSYKQVGTKEPNNLGIHDMYGNVAEWTIDQYYKNYVNQLGDSIAVNPLFIPTELYPRSVRGGSWMDGINSQSCMQRRGSDPKWKMNDPQLPKSLWWHTNAPFVGFRVVKPKNQPETLEEMEKYWIEAIQDYN